MLARTATGPCAGGSKPAIARRPSGAVPDARQEVRVALGADVQHLAVARDRGAFALGGPTLAPCHALTMGPISRRRRFSARRCTHARQPGGRALRCANVPACGRAFPIGSWNPRGPLEESLDAHVVFGLVAT